MALIPRFFLDCVVAIGVPSGKEQIKWVASGFLYGDFFKKDEKGEGLYHVFLVTNRHVFKEPKQVLLRFNPTGKEAAKQYSLHLVDASSKKMLWTPHPNPNIDIAVTTINTDILKKHGIQFAWFLSDKHVAALDKMAELGITEGDFVYTLGFPMGLIGPERNYVIVRSGIIARIQDAIDRRSNEFLIDTFIFPGNSGGPVVTKPEVVAITDTKAVSAGYLIGVIQSYLSYQEFAVSEQTGRRRVMFEENSGLTAVIPIDFVKEAIDIHKETRAKESPP
jgi:S1-C subfamily serine protease